MGAAEHLDVSERLAPLVARYRSSCLWFLREDFVPTTAREALLVLDCLEKHGDREAFIEARRVREWLSQTSSATSAD